MTDPVPARQPAPVAILLLGCLLSGCAGGPPVPPPPKQQAGSPRYLCPDGSSFTKQFDTDTHQTDLFLSGHGAHRLDPVPDPDGGALAQDADFQLRPGATDDAAILTDRSTTARQTCSHTP